MLFTPHLTTGILIGIFLKNPFLAFISGFISHHLLDSLPHFDQGSLRLKEYQGPRWLGRGHPKLTWTFKKTDWIILAADVISMLLIFLLFLRQVPWFKPVLIAAIFGALMPDLLDFCPFWKEKFRQTRLGKTFRAFHHFFHWPLPSNFWHLGILFQALIVLGDLWLINLLI